MTQGNQISGNFTARGEYTYNEGASGWVIAKFIDGRLDCLQYHDTGQTCHAPN